MFLSLAKLALVVSLVNANLILENLITQLPGRRKQIEHLAKSVCSDLSSMLENTTSQDACQNDFTKPVKNIKVASHQPKVLVRCRTVKKLQILLEPSNSWQLLVLVPHYGNNRSILAYSLVRPQRKLSDVSVGVPSQDYVLLSTVLDKRVRPSVWYEQKISAWKEEKRRYEIQVDFINSSIINGMINGVVTWNHTGDHDLCFELYNACSLSGMKSKDIGPEDDQRVVLHSLHPDDECEVAVTGLYGTTKLGYHTPKQEVTNETLPETPKNISLEATQGSDAWTVRVGWGTPRVIPEKYNVTLRTNVITTLTVPGDATEAIFTDVTGNGYYNVSVLAIKEGHEAHEYARAIFPERRSSEWWQWASAALGLLALAVCWLRFKKRIFNKQKPMGSETKPLDEALEVFDTECEDQWEIKSDRLLLHEVIGEGAFGVVRRGTLAPSEKEVAVKMLKEFPSLDEVRAFRLEMELMKSVGAHAHVVSLIGCCSGKRPLIVAQYCARGDLLSFLRRSWDVMVSKRDAKYYNNNIETSNYRNDLFKCKIQRDYSTLVVNKMYDLDNMSDCELTSLDLLSFCRQIAMGMEFLSANRLVHRDLAARNVLVTADKMLKVADFGLSRDVYEENLYKQKGNGKMPVKWMAPESLTRRIYTSQSDVWSFGVVVWEVVTVGASPYPEVPAARLPRLLRAGYRMPRPNNCSSQLYELMLSCWSAAPRSRPTFAEIHTRLDELLNGACAHTYLCLELDDSPAPRHNAYRGMILRGKLAWNNESYDRPLKAIQGNHNHYTSPPVTLSKP